MAPRINDLSRREIVTELLHLTSTMDEKLVHAAQISVPVMTVIHDFTSSIKDADFKRDLNKLSQIEAKYLTAGGYNVPRKKGYLIEEFKKVYAMLTDDQLRLMLKNERKIRRILAKETTFINECAKKCDNCRCKKTVVAKRRAKPVVRSRQA